MRNLCRVLLIGVCVNGLIANRSVGQATAPGQVKGRTAVARKETKADAILRQMADYFGNLPAFSCKLESTLEVTSKERKNKTLTKMTVRLERPNRLSMHVDEGTMGMTVVSDGKQLVQYLAALHQFTVQPAPRDFVGMTDIGAPISLTMLGMSDVVIPAAGAEFYRNLSENIEKSEYIGLEKIGNVMCHHCRFIQEDFDWDIWIDAGKQPLVHKVVPDLSKQLEDGSQKMQDAKVSFVVLFSDWNVSPKFTAEDFAFTPPANSQKVDSFIPEEPPHPLLGQPAPPFTTTDANGHPINLKQYLGKNVILLDFWATWCGPCVEAMPQVDAVAKQFADKGLVFFAVNAGEEPAVVKEFLAKSKLEVPVALDEKNEIGRLYAVEGIPQTLLIGKDGKVQVVHVGYSSKLGKLLTSEIEALLAGKDLASEALAKAEKSDKKDAVVRPSDSQPGGPVSGPSSGSTQPADK